LHRLYLISGGTTLPLEFFWILFMVTLGLTGGAMLLFAKPFESFGYRHSEWNRGGPRSAKFYRVMGTLWVLIAVVMAVPVILIWLHAKSS
jgi:hypothetical protein